MRILVTGHEGFIGKNMVGYLTSKGHTVDGYEYRRNVYPPVEQYDWVVHLGAISSTTERDVNKVLEQNLEFSMNLLGLCDTTGVNFQYASSASVYGPNRDFQESAPLYPQSPYAWSKFLFDRYVSQMTFDVLVQGFRYFNVYGPFEDHKGSQASPVHQFTQQATYKGEIKVFENSRNYLRDFVCVEDVCTVHEKFFDVDQSGIWNVGTGNPVSFMDVASAIAVKHPSIITEIPMPDALKSQYQTYTCADLSKLNDAVDMKWINILDWIKK